MENANWCEHCDKVSKYTLINYDFDDKSETLRIQSWFCPECGVHGAKSELLAPLSIES